ncbi:MAG: DUF5103 domain-containing protein [Dysgonomonas sp.]
MKRINTILFLCSFVCLISAQAYRTQPVSPEIYTIQVNANGDWSRLPLINLNGNDYIQISFDRLSDNSFNRLRYRIILCDASWKANKEMSEIDYLDGFNDNLIDDYAPSINTSIEYTHFNVNVPNRDINFKLSGNYVMEVYEEDEPDKTLLTACFSVLSSQLNIGSSVSSITDIDSNKGHQQLSVTIHHPNLNIRDPYSDLKVFVQQNNRIDNERQLIKPSFIGGNKITYEHNRDLIFEGGNEYRRFETSSYRYNGMNVAHIEYNRPGYSMYITPDRVRADRAYSYDQDQNGRFIVRNKESNNQNTEADYFTTYFTLAVDEPLKESIYLNGNFTNNTFTDEYKMKYDLEKGEYQLSLLLKQGLYNYQYLTQTAPNKYTPAIIEGNHYETENEYSIYVYYRPVGQRYDSLIGFTTIYSRAK